MTLKTPLNAAHRALNARMVDFGGWDMPVNYGSQVDEHHKVRNDCGMFDVSHMCPVDVTGPDARCLLSRLLANDVAKLTQNGKALYSAMLTPHGTVIDDLIVYYQSDVHYRLVVNAGTAIKDLAWMKTCAKDWGMQVTVTPYRDDLNAKDPLGMIAVQGPHARETVWKVFPKTRAATENLGVFFGTPVNIDGHHWFIGRTGYTGEDGFELMIPLNALESAWQALLAAGVQACGLGARDTLRLEAGMNLYGNDMDETVSPLDAGLAWTIARTDARDFVGRQALETQGQQWQFLGLTLLDKGVLRAHQKVISPQGEGEITSGTFSPTLQQSIALARLPLGVHIGDQVVVDIRGKQLNALVVKPVFARHGKALI
jgi:aminomethyltransferase